MQTIGLEAQLLKIKSHKWWVYDLGGQLAHRVKWMNYVSQAEVIIYVIDTAQPERFLESHKELHKIANSTSVPILILLNKQDLEEAVDQVEVNKVFNFSKIINPGRNLELIETSAITAQGLDRVINSIYKITKGKELESPDAFQGLTN